MKTPWMNRRPLVMGLTISAAVGFAVAGCDKGSSSGGEAPAASASAPAAASASAPAASAAAAAPSDAGAATADNADAEAAEDDQVNDEVQAHHRHHQAGFAGIVLSSVETLGVPADQEKAVEGFKKEYHGKMKPLLEANKAVIGLL